MRKREEHGGGVSAACIASIDVTENLAHEGAQHCSSYLFFENNVGALIFFGRLIMTPHVVFGASLTVGTTLAAFYSSYTLSWQFNLSIFFTLAVGVPLMATIKIASQVGTAGLTATRTPSCFFIRRLIPLSQHPDPTAA